MKMDSQMNVLRSDLALLVNALGECCASIRVSLAICLII